MIADLNTVCKYVFKTGFEYWDGIYELTQIATFDAAISDGIDLFESVYKPAGASEERFNSEWPGFKSDQIYYLRNILNSPDDVTRLCIPSTLIAEIPNPFITRCEDFSLAIRLGPLNDPSKLEWAIDYLEHFARSVTGTESEVQVLSAGPVFMTDAEYKALEADRETRIQKINPHLVVIEDQKKLIADLQTKIKYMEDNYLIPLGTIAS